MSDTFTDDQLRNWAENVLEHATARDLAQALLAKTAECEALRAGAAEQPLAKVQEALQATEAYIKRQLVAKLVVAQREIARLEAQLAKVREALVAAHDQIRCAIEFRDYPVEHRMEYAGRALHFLQNAALAAEKEHRADPEAGTE